MPFVGIGLHVLIALFFAIHAVRSGQPIYWLFILFSFPLLGSIVYFIVIYLPDSRLHTGARKAVAVAARALDPSRELREARAAFDFTPTAQNQMRLAAALLAAGAAAEAAANYEACLKGPFASDPEIKFCAARASLESGNCARSAALLQEIRAADAGFRAEPVQLLLARALAGAGRSAEARAQFEAAVARFGSFESRAEYAIWDLESGDGRAAQRLQADIDQTLQRWNRHNRELNAPLIRRLQAARAGARAAPQTGA
jgi:hypothetical protein